MLIYNIGIKIVNYFFIFVKYYEQMKSLLAPFFILLFALNAQSQVVKTDTLEVDKATKDMDTLTKMPIELEEVYISNRYDFRSDEAKKNFLLLKRRVLKVYPYAKAASERLTALNNGMKVLSSEREKKKYFKLVENYLTGEFEDQLKKLSRKEGQVLVKLIHRQTGQSTFELIKDLKSGWKAFWSNNTARLFDINLKTKFNPYAVSEDFIIEGILMSAFRDGILVKQSAKAEMNYVEMANIWREKLKASKAAEKKLKSN